MATFTAIRNKKQGRAATLGTLKYITRRDKIRHENAWLATGMNCNVATSYVEMMLTKEQYKKDSGRYFYQFVQSFAADEILTPEQAHEIGMELAAKQFPDYEVVVATHCDTDNLHNHFLVNSVSYKTGMKLHQCHDDLLVHRQVNDEICMAHGLTVLEPYRKGQQGKGMKPGEYRAAERGESWKFALMNAIDDALLYSADKQSFTLNMEYEGYKVNWSDTRKFITYICPNGMKCRDYRLHDETYLKENMEKLLLSEVVRQCINQCIEKVHIDEKKMLAQLLRQKDSKGSAQLAESEKTLKALHKRSTDIDTIIAKLYEDRALGILPESTCIPLFSKYTAEKQSIDGQIEQLQAAATQQDKTVGDVHKFIELIKGYTTIETLNEEILNTLIDKIYVHQFHKEGKQRKQQIDIYFKFVGEIHFVP